MLCVTDLNCITFYNDWRVVQKQLYRFKSEQGEGALNSCLQGFAEFLQRWSKTDINASTLSIMINNLQVIILNKIIIDMMGYDTDYTTEK